MNNIKILAYRMGFFMTAAVILAIWLSLGCGSSGTNEEASISSNIVGDEMTTATFSYDTESESWFEDITSAPSNGKKAGNTIVVQLKNDEPVKEVSLREVLLINSPTEPTLEIAGSDDPGGEIHICKLVFRRVEAKNFETEDVDVVTMTAVNVTGDNSLQIYVNPVNNVKCGRGGVAIIALGVPSAETSATATLSGTTLVLNEGKHQGLRDNRIKILGPSGGSDGYIETLIVEDSSVFGNIKLKHLRIQEFILDSVTVENE